MKQQRICILCGSPFIADRVTQKYCSSACRRHAHILGMNVHDEPKRGKSVIRVFQCLKCGKLVKVADPKDKRIKFCSSHCERLYWKHSRRDKQVRLGTVQRSFICRCCGAVVNVTEANDRRTSFCSDACRKKWFSRHRKSAVK